jgi:glycosyltransferase involved in cell wall biosynthesis
MRCPDVPRADERGGSMRTATSDTGARKLRVLFFVEGHTDIRFVLGLDEICDLTMVVPASQYVESGLRERIAASGRAIKVAEIPGGRIAFQIRSLAYLWRIARHFDVILAQEMLRGALNANLVGKLRAVPVVTYLGVPPLEYFRCRRERRQIGWLKWVIGDSIIRALLALNGRMATRCLAMGPYLCDVAARYSRRSAVGLYYGVDTRVFRPASAEERAQIRERIGIPRQKFVVFFSSRISHEKDPETVLRAVAIARENGVDAVLLNLGGGWRPFLELARAMHLKDSEQWVIGRPAAHPITEVFDYFRTADVVAQASLAEGAAYSTLEALACGTPVVATAVGGMAVQLDGHARLVARRDAAAMAEELVWVARHPDEARAQAINGREYVTREWSREKAFSDLARVLAEVARRR